ncbi:ATP-binding protein [Alloprevotella sp. OH1205_COT-284]|uniref:AAA family ATPase n=1 Tax=Alloprevotella sp. OH1205_COT-284 TaxID=2491043 RepID=UPI000F5F97FF|nr:AAA family ATPase [Alloprevotella sp. OH1205_COT-284]RRD76243.1 ATP-binding protein [Alloprevotella sp. OH1205_COT-284]
METFFQSHAYLIEHTNAPVRRALMDTIDWSYRLIGIRGPRGVGRTSFLLSYAKENFDPRLRQCLYVNMNSFYFQGRKLVDFAADFIKAGGQVLLIDQAFKLPSWREQLIECYERFPYLRIVFSTTSVRGGENNHTELNSIARQYWLHGFSFREFVNLQTGENFRAYTLKELLEDHKTILKTILPKVRPWEYFQQYLHHGYYPFFLESRNFTENLLRSMNTMIEVDILFIKQIELKYLERIKKLLYLLAVSESSSPNVSKLAEEIGTSRATVMNYLKYLEEARLINLIYKQDESFPKKPASVVLHNPNLIYSIYSPDISEQQIMETFFVNALWRHHTVCRGKRDSLYKINGNTDICVCDRSKRVKSDPNTILARYNTEVGRGDNEIPLWLFGFLH